MGIVIVAMSIGISNLKSGGYAVMRVNHGSVLDEGLRIRERGCQMNSKVKDHTNKTKLDVY
jgi:hypothetical protein